MLQTSVSLPREPLAAVTALNVQYWIYELPQLAFRTQLGDGVSEVRSEWVAAG